MRILKCLPSFSALCISLGPLVTTQAQGNEGARRGLVHWEACVVRALGKCVPWPRPILPEALGGAHPDRHRLSQVVACLLGWAGLSHGQQTLGPS